MSKGGSCFVFATSGDSSRKIMLGRSEERRSLQLPPWERFTAKLQVSNVLWLVGFLTFFCLFLPPSLPPSGLRVTAVRSHLKCDGTRAETRFHLSPKRTSPFKSARASVRSTTGSRGVRISGSNAGYTMFRGSVKGTGYPLHSPVFPSLPPMRHRVSSHFSWTLPILLVKDLSGIFSVPESVQSWYR
jgi:hypothetical protein